jgi:squalene-hopene/tetraprenyl-beta-curcumene cyclase
MRLMKAVAATGVPVHPAVRREATALLERRRPDGSWAGGCRARLLESCLGLHLLRGLAAEPDTQRTLEGYCRAALGELEASPGDWPADRVFTACLARAVVRDQLPSAREQACLKTALEADSHAFRQRKLVLLNALLGLVRPGLSLGSLPLPTAPTASSHHRWVELIMAALRLKGAPRDRERELSFLARAQNADGGWEQHVLATVVIVLALSQAGLAGDLVSRGTAFLLSWITSEGGLPFISNEDTWVTALASLTMAEAGAGRRVLLPSAEYLCRQQLPGGGWAYAAGVSQPDADDTAVAATFLARGDSREATTAARAGAGYLMSLQNADGGFPTFTRGAPSEPEITAKCVRALLAVPGGPDQAAAALRAWNWLGGQQRPDGSFQHEWCLSPAFPVMHVMHAVYALRARFRPPLADAVIVRGVAFLASTGASGQWRLRPADRDPHPLSTAYAISALASLPDPPGELLSAGVRHLLALSPDARCEPDSLGPRPFVYDVPELYRIYRLAALSSARNHENAEPAAASGPAGKAGAR